MKKINVISVVMGSDSDLPLMKEAIEVLMEFNIPHEVLIMSAHRCPEETAAYAKQAIGKGTKVIIAAAGGAAHLAGVMASHFPLPVIGVPVQTPALHGVDSLYSIVQMPPGVPVAAVGINAAKNAALLAMQMVAIGDKKLLVRLINYKKRVSQSVTAKNTTLQKIGVAKYLSQKRT